LIGRGSFIHGSRLMALSLCVCLQMAALAQATSAPPTPDADAKVAAILDGILRRGEGHAEEREDVKMSTWVPPSFSDIEQIREIGHDAIAPLNKALDSQTPFRQLLAVRLLGEIGGTDVVPPLKRGLEANRWVVVRTQSLSSLRSVPDNLALPIIRSAVLDSDLRVAERARTLLTDYYQLDAPK
jgi:HEAT repeat protein